MTAVFGPWAIRPRLGQLVRIVTMDGQPGDTISFNAHARIADLDELADGTVGVTVEGFPGRTVALRLDQLAPLDATGLAAERDSAVQTAEQANRLAVQIDILAGELSDRVDLPTVLGLLGRLVNLHRDQAACETDGAADHEWDALDDDRRHALFQLSYGVQAVPCGRCRPQVLRPALWQVGCSVALCEPCMQASSRQLLTEIRTAS